MIIVLPFIYFMLLFVDGVLTIPLIMLYIVIAIKRIGTIHIKVAVMTLYTCLICLGICIGILIFGLRNLISNFTSENIESIYYSPDKQKTVTVITVDLGATGGGTKAYIERSYFELLKVKRKVFTGRLGRYPNVKWLNNNSVNINGKIFKV